MKKKLKNRESKNEFYLLVNSQNEGASTQAYTEADYLVQFSHVASRNQITLVVIAASQDWRSRKLESQTQAGAMMSEEGI